MSEVIKGMEMRLRPIQKVGMEIPVLAPIVVPGSNQSPRPPDPTSLTRRGNRSDSENLSLETLSSPVVPCCHGYASLIATGSLGTNATRSASLYWRAGGTCGRLGGHSALVRGTGPHLTGTAQQELEEFFTPSIERSASVATSKSPTRSAPSWGSTGASGPYSPPHPGGICR